MSHMKNLAIAQEELREALKDSNVLDVEIPTTGNEYGNIVITTNKGKVSISFDIQENWNINVRGKGGTKSG